MEKVLQTTDNSNNYPNHEDIRQIFNDTYNVFYKKWKDVPNPNWDNMIQEARDLDKKYNCDLCRHITADLIVCIQERYKKKEESK